MRNGRSARWVDGGVWGNYCSAKFKIIVINVSLRHTRKKGDIICRCLVSQVHSEQRVWFTGKSTRNLNCNNCPHFFTFLLVPNFRNRSVKVSCLSARNVCILKIRCFEEDSKKWRRLWHQLWWWRRRWFWWRTFDDDDADNNNKNDVFWMTTRIVTITKMQKQ